MIRPQYLDITKIIQDKRILKLFQAAAKHGGTVRLVGGAVRNVLAGINGFDLDLVTDLSPEELTEICAEEGIKTFPVGLRKDATGVFFEPNKYIVLSLCRGCKKNNSHVEFTDDWNADASERDLTINAVYLDDKGNVFDYYNGMTDLENGIVRFIGDAHEKIRQQPIRILRFFRFHSHFATTPFDQKSLEACLADKELLRNVAVESIRDEILKFMLTKNVASVIEVIFKNNILDFLLPLNGSVENLKKIIHLEEEYKLKPDNLRRLYAFQNPSVVLAQNLAARLHLNKAQKTRLTLYAKINLDVTKITDPKYLSHMIYEYGKDMVQDKILFDVIQNPDHQYRLGEVLEMLHKIETPVFPVSGQDIIGLKLKDNPNIGALISRLKKEWIESDFCLTQKELLKKIDF